jgi:hypothetical protein
MRSPLREDSLVRPHWLPRTNAGPKGGPTRVWHAREEILGTGVSHRGTASSEPQPTAACTSRHPVVSMGYRSSPPSEASVRRRRCGSSAPLRAWTAPFWGLRPRSAGTDWACENMATITWTIIDGYCPMFRGDPSPPHRSPYLKIRYDPHLVTRHSRESNHCA